MSERSTLLAALRALADGTPVDWTSLEESSERPRSSVVDGLRLISRIADVHAQEQHAPADVLEGPAPDRWGAFKIVERLGRGAYGTVYRAWDERLDREVALKLLSTAGPEPPEDSFVREGGLLARVHHDSVVAVYGAEWHEGRVGISMEFVHGRTIDQWVREHGPLNAEDLVRVGAQIASGLAAVHAAGIVHRDINAHNVVVEADGRAVLMDFGAALATDPLASALVGSPLFLAPEILGGAPATMASDVYSLGVLLYFMGTGRYPVQADTFDDLQRAHFHRQRHRIIERGTQLPGWVAATIERACHPDERQRTQSAADVVRRLASGPASRRKHLVAAAAVTLAIGSLLGGSAVWRRNPAPASRRSVTASPAAAVDPLDTVSVHSPAAARAYLESVQLARRGNWGSAVAPAKAAVEIEPTFAFGWIWSAWTIRNAALGAMPYETDDLAYRTAQRAYQPAVDRAVALAPTEPEWERHWILGSAALFRGDEISAVEHMQAVYEATGLNYAANNLLNLANRVHLTAQTPEDAERRVRRIREAIPPERWSVCCTWVDWSPTYVAWRSNRIDDVQNRIDATLTGLRVRGERPGPPAAYFALALGRLTDARELMLSAIHGGGEQGRALDLLAIAEAQGNESEMKRLAAGLPLRGRWVRPSRLIRAGYLARAADLLNAPREEPATAALYDVARGQLLVRDGKYDEARPVLQSGMRALKGTSSREYFDACSSLTEGYERQRNVTMAISVLDECASQPPRYSTGVGNEFFGVWQWIVLRQQAAHMYLLAGRAADAEAIARDLRTKLAYGDRDTAVFRWAAAAAGSHTTLR